MHVFTDLNICQMKNTPKSKLQNKSRYPKSSENHSVSLLLLTPKEFRNNCYVQSIFPFFMESLIKGQETKMKTV